MKFCVECGANVDENEKFCTNCGTRVKQQTAAAANSRQHEEKSTEQSETKEENQQRNMETSIAPESTARSKTKNPKAKRNKIITLLVLVVFLLVFGIHKGLEQYFDPIHDIEAMDEAIVDGDMATYLQYIDFDESAELDKSSYFAYIQEEWEKEIRDQYYSIIKEGKDSNHLLHTNITNEEEETLYKVKKDKKFGLYPTYLIEAVPLELKAMSNIENTTLVFNGEDVKIKEPEKSVELGAVYPGAQEITAKAKSEYGELTYEEAEDISQSDDEIYIEFPHSYLQTESDYSYEDAVIYLDGDKTDFTLEESHSIGPFPQDSKIEAYAEWEDEDGDAVLSDTEEVELTTENESVYFDFDESKAIDTDAVEDSDDKEIEVGQYVLEFRNAYEAAVNHADYDEIKRFSKSGSEAEKELKKFIGDMDDGSYDYDFKDNKVVDIEKDDKTYVVQTNETFDFIDDDGEKYHYDRVKSYDVEESDEEYFIKEIHYDDTDKEKIN